MNTNYEFVPVISYTESSEHTDFFNIAVGQKFRYNNKRFTKIWENKIWSSFLNKYYNCIDEKSDLALLEDTDKVVSIVSKRNHNEKPLKRFSGNEWFFDEDYKIFGTPIILMNEIFNISANVLYTDGLVKRVGKSELNASYKPYHLVAKG